MKMTAPPSPARSSGIHPLATLGLVLTLACGLGILISGVGYRAEWWGLRGAFRVLQWSVIGAAVAALVSLGGVIVCRFTHRPGMAVALVGLGGSLVALCVPLIQLAYARHAPSIHDITTDTDHPPAFVAVLPLRANAANPAAYGGPEIAAQQHTAYPDIVPAQLATPPAQAFSRALATARAMGWTIVATDSAAGRIEATATTFWFGFKDDVVVRLTPDSAGRGARVDVRSVSRVGRGDVGKNARRIREYLQKLTQT
jgi:uncharacterized protein (DUF1499 family)